MPRTFLLFTALLALVLTATAAKKPSYLFAWCGDIDKKGSAFLAVIDADRDSKTYGKVLRTVPTGVADSVPHHTEVEMPRRGFLMANGFEAGRTWIFDLRKPLAPRIVTHFESLDGYMHPHTFFRLKNGNALVTFQYRGSHDPKAPAGGLVEVDDRGKMVRAGNAADPAASDELIRPYSIELLPGADRIVSTNTAMHEADGKTRTLQLWQASTLKVLRTMVLPPGPKGTEQFYPGEPRLLADGETVLVHTFSCGLYMLRGADTSQPSVEFVYGFAGKSCGVPLRIGKYWVQTVEDTHHLAVLDISDPAKPREVSRLDFDSDQEPHWASVDPTGTRIVVNSAEVTPKDPATGKPRTEIPDRRLYIVDFDPTTGGVKFDERFRDAGSDRPGLSVSRRSWPHGFKGNTYAHGTVFSR
ncbi:MAG TPA: hypothetical protein VM056_06535 [Terriglobales bacterium]|nr:hypothetical protein [Terriglobales bacterium]